jgi:undecaprenyl-diphosphatase
MSMEGAEGKAPSARRVRGALAVVILGFLVLAASAVSSGLLLTNVLLDGWLGRWDVDVEETFARHRTSGWNGLTRLTSAMGDTTTVIVIAGVAAAVLIAWHHRHLALLLVTALVVEVSVFLTTAAVVDRPRPPVPRLDDVPPTSSYPSGHTAAATALYIGLALVIATTVRRSLLRALAWIAAVVLTVGVALGRLYRAMHHPTDVAAGLLIGAASLVVAVLTVRALTAPAERQGQSVVTAGRRRSRRPKVAVGSEVAP